MTAQRDGGGFLVGPADVEPCFTPEDLTDEHRAIGRTADEFWTRSVAPALAALHRQEPGVARRLLREAATIGLTSIQLPESSGGLDLDVASMMIAVESLSKDASYIGWHLGHSGIGTLPLLHYGTTAQKEKYLPKLASAEFIGAYALTEADAGSDALAARTRADLSPDGRHYLLRGQKMWVTNGGEADLFTVFAKIGGDAFTAFLVERAFGVVSGAEERKMGLSGTSTTALYFDNVAVPIDNVLGDVGRGHVIALNVLNVGRVQMGPMALGGAKRVLAVCAAYAANRRAFGSAIADFGTIRQKLADMAIAIFAAESAVWRVVGLIDGRRTAGRTADGHRSSRDIEAFHTFALECALIKVHASEMLDAVVDEGVQIHGGYGFHRDYFVEQAYRDARVNRIFEGTNEINRLLIARLLLKGVATGRLSPAEPSSLPLPSTSAGVFVDRDHQNVVDAARRLCWLAVDVARRAYGDGLAAEQEILLNLADLAIETFVMESTAIRAARLRRSGATPVASHMCPVYLSAAIGRVARAAGEVACAACEGVTLERALTTISETAAQPPVNTIALRRRIAAQVIESRRYPFPTPTGGQGRVQA